MRIWAGMAAAGAALLLRSAYERRHFMTERYEIVSEKIKKPKTLVFLSDLHDNCFGSGQKELCETIAGLYPSIGGSVLYLGEHNGIPVQERILGLKPDEIVKKITNRSKN